MFMMCHQKEECLPKKVREASSAAAMIGFDRFIEDDEDFNPPDIPDELFEGYENEGSDFFVSMSKDEKVENSDQNSEEKSYRQSVVAVDDQKVEEDEIIEQQAEPEESNSREHQDDDWQLVYKQRESLKKDEQLDSRIDDEQISFDQAEDHAGLETPLNSEDKMKDHVFKEASFYNAKGESKKVITNNEIIDEVPNDLWSEEDDELAYTFEKLHIQGTAEGFMAEEMSNANKKATIFADQSQDLKRVSVSNEDKTVESDQINDSFARVYERGMHTSAEAFRSRMVNDVFSKIADKNAPPEEKALEDLIRKQRTIEDRIRVEDTIERLKNADNSKILHSEMDKPVNPFIPAIKNKPRSNFVPKVNISFSPHKKGVKLAFLKNKLLVITTVKQCRVNAVNEKIENVKYVERFYKIKSNQRVDAITKAEIKQKATNTTVRHNIYALLLDVGSFKRTGVRMSNDPGLNETMILSFKDKLAATMRCIEQKDYAMAFLLSKDNREAEQAAVDAYLQNFVDPLFHCFFCSTAENVRPYHTEPYPRDDGRWAEVLSLLLEKKNVNDHDMENLLKIKKARGEQFYVLVLLYLKFRKSFFHRYKDVLLTNYEFMRIMNYLKIKDVEDLKAYYEEYFMVTDKEVPVTSGGWGWKNYVEKGISKIIGIDSTFMENEAPKELSKRDENEQNKTVAESKSHSDENLSAKRKMDHQIKDGSESNTLLAKEALFEKHIKLAKENMERTEEKAVPDYASSFADFFVSEPLLVPDTSYDDQSLPKSVIDRDKDDESDVIIAKKEEKGWGFSLLNLFKRKEKRYKVKCNVECDFKYDPQTKRWVNTKAQATKAEKVDSKKDAAVPEKNVPLPCPVTRKAGTKKVGDSIASRYVIGNSAADGDEVNASDIFGVCKKK
ncbi:hypothetical protein THOM_2521 [Trachipleistophora hominis]|uniref:Uncharacterized protein n=1 Tax=Trachipleistophora hominis TaxID=72359 RepID=L7JV19_TRAHO|nr:hypothetical protein THOM_2521 [Trachipleistophora hominis]